MFAKYPTRREFIQSGGLSLLFLLNSCSNFSEKVTIALQNSFYPDSFKDTIPKSWQQNKINLGSLNKDKNREIILNSSFTLINDGWLDSLNIEDFKKLNENSFLEMLDKRSTDFLNIFEENQRYKIFPIGLVPYAIIIKNNKHLIKSASQSWDFLLSEKLNKKIIFPKSPRLIKSIAEKINTSQSLAKINDQAMVFDDQNSLNWLINSDACVAIVPYSLCSKYLKIDSRLSIVFPDQGVPLVWYFVLSRSTLNNEILFEWIKSLEVKSTVSQLSKHGWYLPFNNYYSQSQYKSKISEISGPSQQCWAKSWSLPPLTTSQKLNFEKAWNDDLTP